MKIIVIGGGIAGLGSATYFSRKGHDVTVFEASDRIGGRAITQRSNNGTDLVDAGTQFFHSNYKRALRLLEETGLKASLTKVKGHTRVIEDSHGKKSFLINHRLPWYSSIGVKGNLKAGYFLLSKFINIPYDPFNIKFPPDLDLTEAISDNTSKVITDTIIRPLCLIGALAEPDAMKVSMYHLMRLIRVVLLTDYLVLPKGIVSLHEALADRLNIKRDTPAGSIITEKGNITGVMTSGKNEIVTADHVVIATTPDIAAGLIPKDWNEEREFLNTIKIPSFILPTFFLDRPLERGVWSWLLHNHGGIISYITDAREKNPAMVPSGNSIIQPWVCFPDSIKLSGKTDQQIIDLCRLELGELFPGFSSWIEEVTITRHKHAVPFHSIGHHKRSVNFLNSTDARGISFCGDYLTGGYMESALWSAHRAAVKNG